MHEPLREGRRWLRQANTDLRAARLLAEPIPSLACFHAQQAAEKALKAVLHAAGHRVVLGHSLSELGTRVAAVIPGYEALRGDVAKLDRYYVPTRYPNGLPPGTAPDTAFDLADADAAIATAAGAVEHARAFLDAHPGA